MDFKLEMVLQSLKFASGKCLLDFIFSKSKSGGMKEMPFRNFLFFSVKLFNLPKIISVFVGLYTHLGICNPLRTFVEKAK